MTCFGRRSAAGCIAGLGRDRGTTDGDTAATGMARLAVVVALLTGLAGADLAPEPRSAAEAAPMADAQSEGLVVLDPDRAARRRRSRGIARGTQTLPPRLLLVVADLTAWERVMRIPGCAPPPCPDDLPADPDSGRASLRGRLGGPPRPEAAAWRGAELGTPRDICRPMRRPTRATPAARNEIQENPNGSRVQWQATCACESAPCSRRTAGRGRPELRRRPSGRSTATAASSSWRGRGRAGSGSAGRPGCARRGAERGGARRAGRGCGCGRPPTPAGEGQPAAAGRGLEHGGLHQRGADAGAARRASAGAVGAARPAATSRARSPSASSSCRGRPPR